MYRNPKQSLIHRSVPGFMAPCDGDTSGDFLKTLEEEKPMAGTVTPRVTHYPNTSTDGSSPDSDLEFVASTKVRMKELEREAERLDKAFQDYHRRVSQYPAARSPLAAGSPPAPHLLGALKSIPSGSSERIMLTEDEAMSEPPAGDVATVLVGTGTALLRRGPCRRPSSMPLAKAKRGLDGKMHLEGKLQKGLRPLAWIDRALGRPLV